jgi:hypothetical protein
MPNNKRLEELRDKYLHKEVELINATYGWGDYATKGSRGIVSDVFLYGVVPALSVELCNKEGKVRTEFLAAEEDIILVKSTPVDITLKVENLFEKYKKLVENRSVIYKSKRISVCNEIKAEEDVIRKHLGMISELDILIKSALSKSTKLNKATTAKRIDKLLKHYEEVIIRNNTVYAFTQPITMKWEDYKHNKVSTEMGKYKIVISIEEGTIRFTYIDGGYGTEVYNNYMHPHILSCGEACFGTWNDKIGVLLGIGDYIGVLELCYEFLSECDRHGWYINGYAFAEDNKDRCNGCWELSDDCECEKCDSCGAYLDNCDCDRCPDTNDIIDDRDEYCRDCGNRNEEGGCDY